MVAIENILLSLKKILPQGFNDECTIFTWEFGRAHKIL